MYAVIQNSLFEIGNSTVKRITLYVLNLNLKCIMVECKLRHIIRQYF